MARLGDIASVITKGTTPTSVGFDFADDGINFIKIESISETGEFIPEKFAHIDSACHEKLKRSQLAENDILFSIAGAIGRTAIVNKNILPANTNQALAIIRIPSGIVDYSFLDYVLQSPALLEQFESQKQGVAQLNLSLKNIGDLIIPDFSLEKQRSIATVLDKVSALIALRKQQLAKLDELVKSRFIELFGNPETNPRGLPELLWRDVFLTTTGKLDSNAMVDGGQYPFFTCAKESFRIDTYAFDCEALLLAGNNAAGVYDVKHYKGKFNAYQRTYVLRLVNEQWSYILFKQQLEDKLLYLQSRSKGTNTRYLTLGILNELRFIVPSIDEQNQFAAFVEQVDKSKLTIQQGLDKLETLKKSLMQEYFG